MGDMGWCAHSFRRPVSAIWHWGMVWRMPRSVWCPFVATRDTESTQMGSEPEAQEDDEDWGLPLEMSPQLEGRKWSLFFRLARKRADYFSDIEDILRMPDIDQLPTRDLSAFRRAIEAILTQPEGLLSIAEQPTRLSWMIEQPTRPLPGPMEQPTGVRSTPALLRGAADMRAEQPGGRESGPRR